MKWLLVAGISLIAHLVIAGETTPLDTQCTDLSGRYRYWGEWGEFAIEGGTPKGNAAIESANTRPRLDQFGLSLQARQIVVPQVVVLRHDVANAVIVVDIVGKGIDMRGIDNPLVLPVSVAVKCVHGASEIDSKAAGGGENVLSETVRKTRLRIAPSGELLVAGEVVTVKGVFFKSRIVFRWTARFTRMAD